LVFRSLLDECITLIQGKDASACIQKQALMPYFAAFAPRVMQRTAEKTAKQHRFWSRRAHAHEAPRNVNNWCIALG
jgi:hypothetical protein